MEDSDFLCPLCCEELDISDRNFYPCKCGYQVCMWCWHRIRESESGLCPACRTPYGDDPHAFSAVDVEEVLREQSDKAAAALLMKEQSKKLGYGAGSANASLLEERSALANMRVIRRNLVYAVGLPPLSEETLKKAEYFGQYGKMNKIVINRNNPPAGDARRASASAYVTFIHKEDTLSCILALDGFYMDGRNVRASYGTSKYCSAFIKNVRCNNPDCTYLHSMGEKEDTFTKQEIQAGYVTSGRDVLERQMQLNLNGGRMKVGGGGPSGTGKASPNPIFPAPQYEDTAGSHSRSQSVGNAANFPPAKLGRSSSATSPPRPQKSAASVVAGMHAVAPEPPSGGRGGTTLVPLTPLKRLSGKTTKTQESRKSAPSIVAAPVSKPEATIPSIATTTIGGSIIGGPIGGSFIGGSGMLGGGGDGGISSLNSLGGEVYTGELMANRSGAFGGNFGSPYNGGVIGGNKRNINNGEIGGSAIGFGLMGGGRGDNWQQQQGGIGAIGSGANNNGLAPGGGFGGAIGLRGGGVIGAPPKHSPIGGMAIGGGRMMDGNNKPQSDMALLQSLLPGVHITSGHGQQQQQQHPNDIGWNNNQHAVGPPNGVRLDQLWSASGGGGGGSGSIGGNVIGAPKHHAQQQQQLQQQQQQQAQQQQQQQQGNNIW